MEPGQLILSCENLFSRLLGRCRYTKRSNLAFNGGKLLLLGPLSSCNLYYLKEQSSSLPLSPTAFPSLQTTNCPESRSRSPLEPLLFLFFFKKLFRTRQRRSRPSFCTALHPFKRPPAVISTKVTLACVEAKISSPNMSL